MVEPITGAEEPQPQLKPKPKLEIDSLPDISQIVLPEMKVTSTRIRWLLAMGYSINQIHHGLGLRYQQVRNVATTTPKRAAREDLPPLVLVLRDPIDDVQAIMDMALDESLKKAYKERNPKVGRQGLEEPDE